jgi:hypothetical protein
MAAFIHLCASSKTPDGINGRDTHMRRILKAYTDYYNELRTLLSLSKDSPGHRPVQLHGQLAARPISSPLGPSWAGFIINTAGHSIW